jgi:Fe-S-cluster containining protein
MNLDTVLEMTQRMLDSGKGPSRINALVFYATPVSTPPGDWPRYRCDRLGSDRRCTVYAERPDTCRSFPGRGHVCSFCGFSLAKQRRATRRQIRRWIEDASRARTIARAA